MSWTNEVKNSRCWSWAFTHILASFLHTSTSLFCSLTLLGERQMQARVFFWTTWQSLDRQEKHTPHASSELHSLLRSNTTGICVLRVLDRATHTHTCARCSPYTQTEKRATCITWWDCAHYTLHSNPLTQEHTDVRGQEHTAGCRTSWRWPGQERGTRDTPRNRTSEDLQQWSTQIAQRNKRAIRISLGGDTSRKTKVLGSKTNESVHDKGKIHKKNCLTLVHQCYFKQCPNYTRRDKISFGCPN